MGRGHTLRNVEGVSVGWPRRVCVVQRRNAAGARWRSRIRTAWEVLAPRPGVLETG